MSKKHRKNKKGETDEKVTRDDSSSDPGIKHLWAYIGILVLLVLIAYANAFNAAFVSDDVYGILNNAFIREWSSVTAQPLMFLQPFFYFVISNVFGIIPVAFRMMNILAHTGTVIMTFLIGSILVSPIVAFFAAALFAVHPLMIESVTWISGGPYVWYAFLFMLSWWFYIKSKQTPYYYYVSLVFYFLSLTIGIPAVVLCGVLFIYEYFYGDLKKNWPKLIPYFVFGAFYGYRVISGIGAREHVFKTDHYQETIRYPLHLQIPVAISSYLELFVWPKGLTLYHSELQFTVTQFTVKVIITVSYFIALIYSFFKNRFVFLSLSMFLIGLLPTLTPYGIHWVVGERYAYFSIIGISFVIAYFLAKIPKKFEVATYLLIITMLIGFTVRTIMRNNDWKNEDNLWIATGKTSPSDPKTHNNLADVYARQGKYKEAAEELIIAIKLNKNYGDAYHNLGNIYQRTGQLDAALGMYNHALTINPRLWQSYQNIGALYFAKEEYGSAEAYMKQAINLNPNSSQLRSFLGIVYLRSGRFEESRNEFNTALEMDVNNELAKMGLIELDKLPKE